VDIEGPFGVAAWRDGEVTEVPSEPSVASRVGGGGHMGLVRVGSDVLSGGCG
jgi:hypothetical protein